MEKTVIVLGKTVTALSTLRALKPLRKSGYTIMFATNDRKENIAYHSNVSDKKWFFSNGLVEGLMSIGRLFKTKPILLFAGDPEVVELNQHRSKLANYFTFLIPEPAIFQTLMEKVSFSEFALAKGLPIPQTAFIKDQEELKKINKKIPYPFIVKPYLLHAVKVDNDQQLHLLTDRLEPIHYHSAIVQRYIEGADDHLFFVFLLFDQNGKLVHKMMAKKLRQWPISYGTTSLAVTISNDRLWKEVQKFIEVTDIVGYCSIEYKYDQKTDRYFIMEPTIGRFNQQIALTAASGVNFPTAMVRLLSGEKVEIKPQKNNVFWIYESNDLFSYFHSNSSYGYLKNFFKRRILVLFSFTDPMPMLFEIYTLGRKKMRKILKYARFHWNYPSERPADRRYT